MNLGKWMVGVGTVLIPAIAPVNSFATAADLSAGHPLTSTEPVDLGALHESSTMTLAQNPLLPQPPPPTADPNRDRLLQPLPGQVPLPDPPPVQPPVEGPASPAIAVRNIEIKGSTLFSPEELQPLVQPLEGRTVTLSELRQLADAITQRYIERGFITSRAVLGEQTLVDGVVTIQVIEGRLGEIQVEGNRRLNASYVRSRIRLGAEVPLNTRRLEEQLRLLKTDPLLSNIEASLQPGTNPGESVLVVRVEEADRFSSAFGIDNYTPPSIAPERWFVSLAYQNLSGIGDQLSASYAVGTNLGNFDQAASNVYDIAYIVPVNAMNGTVLLQASLNNNKVTQPDLAAFGITAESESYQLSFRQPLIRTLRHEFALSLGLNIQGGQTFIFNNQPSPFGIGPDANGVSRTRVLQLGQDYVRRDELGTWALRSQLNFGLPVLGATENPGAIPDGQFFSWLGQGQRVQRLGSESLLILQADLQLTPNGLLPFQQFVIGGGQSVRGYPQNARSGDNGFRFSVEGRFPVLSTAERRPIVQLAPFFDIGNVWNVSDNPNGTVSEGLLAGAGLGLIFQPLSYLDIRLDYAAPFLQISDTTKSLQDDAFYFSIVFRP